MMVLSELDEQTRFDLANALARRFPTPGDRAQLFNIAKLDIPLLAYLF